MMRPDPSRISPNAFTTAISATRSSLCGDCITAQPNPPFIAIDGPSILPTVVPVPASTDPSAIPVDVAFSAPAYAICGLGRESNFPRGLALDDHTRVGAQALPAEQVGDIAQTAGRA